MKPVDRSPSGAHLRTLVAWARADALQPAAAVAAVAAGIARTERWPAPGRAAIETLTDGAAPKAGVAGTTSAPPEPPSDLRPDPLLFGQLYELLLDTDARRAQGAFFTPPAVARRLVQVVFGDRPSPGPVIDPAVGGGAFLLAAGDELLARGERPPDALVAHRLHGADIDPTAVAITRLALGWWAWRASGEDRTWPPAAGRHVVVADALVDGRAWPDADPARPAVVLGNPPFLGQLTRRTARSDVAAAALVERYGAAAKGYVDGAALFLLAASYHVAPGSRIGLILPESVLVAAHAEALRRTVLERGTLTDLWLGGADVFAAGVRVCAPVVQLEPRREGAAPTPLRMWSGPDLLAAGRVEVDRRGLAESVTWGPLTARLRKVPMVHPRATAGRLADLADATAGFRDQFYGLAPFVDEAVDVAVDGPIDRGVDGADGERQASRAPRIAMAPLAPLVTAGAIDPAVCWWGRRPGRFAGRLLTRPVVDLSALAERAPDLSRWVRSRLRSKVLVATQGKVVEAIADPGGCLVPSVPVVSVEPRDPADVWRLLSVLLSPVTTAWALEHFGGAGLAGSAVKLSARQLLSVPLPAGHDEWAEAADHCRSASSREDPRERRDHLRRAGLLSCAAYGVGADTAADLVSWWERRLPGPPSRL